MTKAAVQGLLCTSFLSCAALLLPSQTHLKDELGPKLLPLAIVDLNIGKGKCGPGLFNKNLQTAPGLPLCLSLLLCSGQGCSCPGGGRSLPWVCVPQAPAPVDPHGQLGVAAHPLPQEGTARPSPTAKHRAWLALTTTTLGSH